MSQILLNTRGVVLDDETGKTFTAGDMLSYIKYKNNENSLNTFYDVVVKCINYKYVHINTNKDFKRIRIDDIISWN